MLYRTKEQAEQGALDTLHDAKRDPETGNIWGRATMFGALGKVYVKTVKAATLDGRIVKRYDFYLGG